VAEVIAAADSGDERAAASLEEVAEWTGVGLRAVVNVFNPEMIVLGGVLAHAWAARPRLVEGALSSGGLVCRLDRVTLCAGALGDDSPLLGAAELAFAPLLADPLGTTGSQPAALAGS
jgi:predicted NBD/HSP70 family sugar kinase